jgi:hypothetical protein
VLISSYKKDNRWIECYLKKIIKNNVRKESRW